MQHTLLQETKIHGTLDFPYIVYHGKIPDFIISFPLHWHKEAEFIYIAKGQMKVTVWSESYYVQEGDIIILMPHTLHAIEQLPSTKAEYFNILFDFSILGATDEDICYQKYFKPFITHEKIVTCYQKSGGELNSLLKPLLFSLIDNRHNSYTSHECLVKSNLFLIMHHLNQHCVNTCENTESPYLIYSKLKAAFYHIQNSYSNPITIKETAALCGFSESHFMKLFKDLTGMSFTSYLINYRLELAANQLTETNASIIEIATNCGFNNHSYFTRAFTKKYGNTPGSYRKNNKKQ